jgi:hypothetical protein
VAAFSFLIALDVVVFFFAEFHNCLLESLRVFLQLFTGNCLFDRNTPTQLEISIRANTGAYCQVKPTIQQRHDVKISEPEGLA